MKDQKQIKEENSPKKVNMWGGKGWIGNILKNREPLLTPEEYWKKVRDNIKDKYKPLFDSSSKSVRSILLYLSKIEDKDYIPLYLGQFKDLTEKDFQDLHVISSELHIWACEPGELLKTLLYKESIEGFSIKFSISPSSIKDMFNPYWRGEYYTITF